MKTFNSRILAGSVSVVALACILAACAGQDENGAGDTVTETSRDDITAALSKLPNAKIVAVDDDGVPTFIEGDLGAAAAPSALRMMKEDVSSVVPQLAPAFRAAVANLTFSRSHKDNLGDTHYRFTQKKNGKDVLGAEFIVHVRNGKAYAANGNVRDDLQAPTAASLSPDQAVAKAKASATHVVSGLDAKVEKELSYLQKGNKLYLVHPISVTGVDKDGTPVRDTVLVDAVDGSILQRNPHIHTAKVREIHDSKHTSSTPGTLLRSEGGAPVSDNIANVNYDKLGFVYECYKQMFGRDSYDGNGGKFVSSIHYSTNYVNAYWDGTQMVYGDGDGQEAANLAISMDVTAHELTHAVTASTSNLDYSGQSGGLNEGTSDIFGATCEYFADGRSTVDPLIWVIGHDIWTPNGPSDDGLRYMNDPKKDGTSIDWAPDFADQDVHYTSGVPNLVYYLMAMGGKHPRGKSTIQVPALGIEKAAQIWFRANTTIFTSSTNYAAAKTATEQAAKQLGYSADDIAAVTAAWNAVGVGTTTGGGGGSSSSSSGGGSSSGSTSGGGGTCKHSTCSTGTKLPKSCDPCVAEICAADSYCCSTKWDSTCVGEVKSICGQSTCN